MIPDSLVIDESFIPFEAMEQLILVREYTCYFQLWHYGLITFMVLLVLGIILITRNVRDTTWVLGIDWIIYGAMEFAGVYFLKLYALRSLLLSNVSSSLQACVVQLSCDMLYPLMIFSPTMLAVGAA